MTPPRAIAITLVALLVASMPAAAGKADRARQEIIEADTNFAVAMMEHDLERFAGMVSEESLFFGSGIDHGRKAVAAAWSPLFAPDAKSVLSWKPVRAEVASSGDLGYTVGSYELRSTDDAGKSTLRHGVYVTIWRKEKDGVWRAALDIGTPPGAEPLGIPAD
jgi:ketosteroid isomerase-like protein